MNGRRLLLLLALTACAAPEPAPLSAEVRQYRNDVALRRLSVTVTNHGGAPVTVTGVRLLAPGFAALPMAEVDVDLPPGDRVDLPVPYGDVRCAGPSPTDTDRAELRVAGRTVAVALPAGGGLLQRLRDKDCAQQELARTAALQLGRFERRGLELRGPLLLTRRGGAEPVRVTEPGGHIVFTVRPAAALPALAPGAQQVAAPLVVTATRCDGHALSQNSRSSVFTFYVAVGAAEPLQVATTADAALQAQLDALARDTCTPG